MDIGGLPKCQSCARVPRSAESGQSTEVRECDSTAFRSETRHARFLTWVHANGEHVNVTLLELECAAGATYPHVCFAERFRALERLVWEDPRGLRGEPDHEAMEALSRTLDTEVVVVVSRLRWK
jgi:hypothetical protein